MLKTAASQDSRWHTGRDRGEWEWVLRRNIKCRGGPDVPFLRCHLMRLSIFSRRFIFTSPLFMCRMWLRSFQASHSISHSFLIKEEINFILVTFAPRDCSSLGGLWISETTNQRFCSKETNKATPQRSKEIHFMDEALPATGKHSRQPS